MSNFDIFGNFEIKIDCEDFFKEIEFWTEEGFAFNKVLTFIEFVGDGVRFFLKSKEFIFLKLLKLF